MDWDDGMTALMHRSAAPEHGPPNYQIALPYTRQPVASIWEINSWMSGIVEVREWV